MNIYLVTYYNEFWGWQNRAYRTKESAEGFCAKRNLLIADTDNYRATYREIELEI